MADRRVDDVITDTSFDDNCTTFVALQLVKLTGEPVPVLSNTADPVTVGFSLNTNDAGISSDGIITPVRDEVLHGHGCSGLGEGPRVAVDDLLLVDDY